MAGPAGPRHPSIQRLRRLSRRRSARRDEAAYVIEGPVLVGEAIAAGVRLDEIIVAGEQSHEVADRAVAAGARVVRTRLDVLARAVDTVTPQDVAAIAALPDSDLAESVAAAAGMALALVGVSDPGNAGTLLRTAEAAGAGAVLFCDGSVDPYNPKCVRSSAGSLFRVDVVREIDAVTVLERFGDAGYRRIGTSADSGTPHDQVDLSGPFVLVLGNEAHGLPAEVDRLVDEHATIVMAGRAESLNVAMAGAVVCFEARRQRRSAGAAGT